MDPNTNEEKEIKSLLRRNMTRSDTWIAKSVKGTPLEMIRKLRATMEGRGELPYFDLFIGSNGEVKPRDDDPST
jgi:hypothetical protein